MSARSLVAVVGLAGVLTLPGTFAHAAEPLAPGSYLLSLTDEVFVTITVGEDFSVDVDAPVGVDVLLRYDGDSRPLDELTVHVGDDEVIEVDIDADDDGSYTYAMESSGDDAADVDSDDAADVDSDDAADVDSDEQFLVEAEAPGQQGRDNARENGGNANGHGAEDVDKDERKQEREADKAQREQERDDKEADPDDESSPDDEDSVSESSADESEDSDDDDRGRDRDRDRDRG